MKPVIKHFFHNQTSTYTYVVSDPETLKCAIIDTCLDLNYKAGRICSFAADELLEYIGQEGLNVDWILETHAHADHLSAADYIRGKVGGKLALGERIVTVQEVFKKFYNLGDDFEPDGSQFDHLFKDGDIFKIGNIEGKIIHTPGHTPACISYVFEGAVFVGDTLFMPDSGTARSDFPGGDAATLYRSIQKIFALPGDTKLYMCHDYKPDKPHPRWVTTVNEEKKKNIYIQEGVTEEMFVAVRNGIDASLDAPVLILPAIQINIRAGKLPPPEEDGGQYLKIPINKIGNSC